MTTQLRLVAVGRIDTSNPLNDTLDCEPGWEDTWHVGAQNSIDALPLDYPTLFAQEDAYNFGLTDRDLGLPSHASDYANDYDRAAYLAGRCAAKRILSAKEILAELEDLHSAMDDENFWRLGLW